MTSDQSREKLDQFHKRQRAIRRALVITTMIVDEGDTTVADLVERYHVSHSWARTATRFALSEKLIKVVRTRADRAEVLTITNKGWQLALLMWIGRHGVATEGYLNERFKLPPEEGLAMQFIELGVKKGLLRNGGVLRGEPELVIATRQGLKAVGLTMLRVCPVADRIEGHLRTAVMLALRLERWHRYTHEILSEREILLASRGKKRGGLWTHVRIEEEEAVANPVYHVDPKTGAVKRKRPDGLMEPRSPKYERVALEAELSSSPHDELVAQGVAWRDCETVGQVLYFTSPETTVEVRQAFAQVLDGVAPSSSLEPIQTAQPQSRDGLVRPTHKLSVIELADEDVPAERRKQFYELRQMPGSHEYFQMLDEVTRKTLKRELLSIVEWIGWHGFTPVDAIATQRGLLEEDACQLLVLAHGAGWLEFTTMLREEGALFRMSPLGRQALAKELPPTGTVTYSRVSAEAMCSRVAAALECEYRDCVVQSRDEMRTDHEIHGERLLAVAPAHSRIGDRRRPDMQLITRKESKRKPIAVVIEPSAMAERKVQAVIRAYSESDEFEKTVYYAAYPQVLKAAKLAVKRLETKAKVAVKALPLSRVAQERLWRTREPDRPSTPTPKASRTKVKPVADCSAESHAARQQVVGWPYRGVSDLAWAEICDALPHLACGPKRRGNICSRTALNGILSVLSSEHPWLELPTELGFGSGATCLQRLSELRDTGALPQIRAILTRAEPALDISWDRTVPGRRSRRAKSA
jgi:transposase